MKFAASILTALVASASALSLEKRMQLLEKATPLGKNRKLEENQGFQITAYDSIQFNSCISLETQLSDEMKQTLSYSSDLLALWESGDIVSQKSVVLFSVCKTEYCSYKAEDNLYVVPLADYMALTQYRPQKQLDYCEACEQAYDWCT